MRPIIPAQFGGGHHRPLSATVHRTGKAGSDHPEQRFLHGVLRLVGEAAPRLREEGGPPERNSLLGEVERRAREALEAAKLTGGVDRAHLAKLVSLFDKAFPDKAWVTLRRVNVICTHRFVLQQGPTRPGSTARSSFWTAPEGPILRCG